MSRLLECGCSSGSPGDGCRERGEWHVEQYTDGKFWIETQTLAYWRPNYLETRVAALEAVLDGYGARDMETLSKKLKAAEQENEQLRARVEWLYRVLDETNARADETNARADETNARADANGARMLAVRAECVRFEGVRLSDADFCARSILKIIDEG